MKANIVDVLRDIESKIKSTKFLIDLEQGYYDLIFLSGVNTKSRQAIIEKFVTDLGGYLQSVDYPKKYAENTAAVLIGSLITLEDPSQVSSLLTVLVYVLTHEIAEDK